MKNYLLIFSLCLCAIQAKSQTSSMAEIFPKNATYYIKGGGEITYSKIDSVIASWGGAFDIEHDDNNKITISKPTPLDAKFLDELKAKANLALHTVAKDFTLTDINGKTCTLSSLKGKVIVLNFWFTTCAGCIQEMPDLNKIRKSYTGKNVVFLAMGRDNAEAIKGFIKQHAFDYTQITNAAKVADDYNIAAYPTSMVINKQGIISFVQVSGDKIADTLPAAINAAL